MSADDRPLSAWPPGDGEMATRIRAHDWASTPLGPIDAWPRSLKTAVTLMLGARQPVYIAWGRELISLYNEGYIPILGSKHPAGLGQPYAELWPEIWDEFRPIAEAVFTGEGQYFVDRPVAIGGRPDVPVGWFTFSWTPLHDDSDEIAGIYCAATETTQRVLSDRRRTEAEAALRKSEEHLALALGIGGLGHWELDLDAMTLSSSALCRANFGRPPDAPFSYEDLIASIHPDDRERQQRTVAAAIEARSGFDIEYRILTPSGELRWIEVRGRFEDGDGKRLVGVSRDITAPKAMQDSLRDSEQRLAAEVSGSRLLQRLSTRLIPEQSPEALYEQILDTALELMRADAVSIQLLDDDGKRLRRVATRNLHPKSTEYWTWVDASHASTCGQALGKNERVMVEDVEASADLAGTGDLEAFRASGTRAVQSSPLLTRTGRPIGMISTHWRAPRRFDESDFGLFDILARQVADLFERSRAEAALRASEERQAFLLKLNDAMRAEPDADAIVYRAVRMLADEMGLDRCYATAMYPAEDRVDVIEEFRRADLAPMPSPLRFSDFPEAGKRAFDRTLVFDDTANDPDLTDADKRSLAAMESGALLSSPVRRGAGNPIWALGAVSSEARRWTPAEIALIEDVAERTWDAVVRARAADALAASEEKYRTIFDSIDEGFALIEVILDDEGKPIDLLHIETNRAYERHTGLRDVAGKRALEVAPHFDRMWFEFYGKVARTGEAARTEYYVAAPVDRWFALHASRIGGEDSRKIAVVFNDITDRKRAEAVLRESEERQTFLLRLSDALRPLDDPKRIAATACRLLVEQLGGSQAQYADLAGPPGREMGAIIGEYFGSGDPFPQHFPLAPFGEPILTLLRSGRTLELRDVDADARLDDAQRAAFHAVKAPAVVSVPLVKEGRWIAALTLQSLGARDWTAQEVGLVEETAERTWATIERARVEALLRESEERQTFLLKLSDALRAEPDADATALLALRTLAEGLQLDRCYIADYRLEEDRADIPYQVGNDRAPPLPESIRLSDFPEALKVAVGHTLVIDDVGEAEFLSDVDKRNMQALGMGALATSAARKGENLPLFTIVAVSATPRNWTSGEIALIEEVNERTWATVERARAEAALRESEEKYRRLFETMGQGFVEAEIVRDSQGNAIDVRLLELNAAFERLTGVSAAAARGRTNREIFPDIEDWWVATAERIVRLGVPERVESELAALGRWYEVYFHPASGDRFTAFYEDITERKRAEAVLRESEERQRFLLELSDAMRAEDSADAIIAEATRMLGEALGASRIVFAEIDDAAGLARIRDGWTAAGAEQHPPVLKLEDFGGPLLDHLRAGKTVRYDDVGEPPYARPDLAALAAIGIKAGLSVPLIVGGRFVVNINVHQHAPRIWTDAEIALTEAVAERTWAAVERVRAEERLRASESRLQTLMQGVPQLVWRAIDGGCWTWASPQWTSFTGQAEADSHGFGWLDAVHPDDREAAREMWGGAIERGEFHADYRLHHAEENRFRWFQTRALPVRDDTGRIVEWLGTSTDVDDLRRLQERQKVLVAELQHRTRNLMGVVRSTANRTLATSASLDDFGERFRDRIDALGRVQGLLSRLEEHDRVTFDALIRAELAAMEGESDKVTLDGPAGVRLRSSMVQTLAMALHELATNAGKYGALAQPDGRLAIRWSVTEANEGAAPWLTIDGRESGVALPAAGPPQGGGQGRELIEKALPYQLGAETSFAFEADGVHCTIALPVSASNGVAKEKPA